MTLLALAAVGYAGLCCLVAWQQTSLIFFPSSQWLSTPKDRGLAFEDWSVPSSDGAVLHAWKIPPASGNGPWVLHCHGNGGNLSYRLEVAEWLHRLGCGVVLFDYRGYGRSTGQLQHERQLLADGQAVYDRLAAETDRIVLYGESLGGGVAAALAEKNPYLGLVLQSTFTRLTDRAGELYRFLPVAWLSRFRLATLDRLPNLHGPVLVMHSPEDEIIPVHHGQRLYSAAPEPKIWTELRGSHNDLDRSLWFDGMRQFLSHLERR